jgi:hypothetical protein
VVTPVPRPGPTSPFHKSARHARLRGRLAVARGRLPAHLLGTRVRGIQTVGIRPAATGTSRTPPRCSSGGSSRFPATGSLTSARHLDLVTDSARPSGPLSGAPFGATQRAVTATPPPGRDQPGPKRHRQAGADAPVCSSAAPAPQHCGAGPASRAVTVVPWASSSSAAAASQPWLPSSPQKVALSSSASADGSSPDYKPCPAKRHRESPDHRHNTRTAPPPRWRRPPTQSIPICTAAGLPETEPAAAHNGGSWSISDRSPVTVRDGHEGLLPAGWLVRGRCGHGCSPRCRRNAGTAEAALALTLPRVPRRGRLRQGQ